MNKTKDNKPHIGIYGRRNNGKSSIINKLADQDIAIVSDTAGTTTDPVKKSFEILNFGPVVLIDTAGIDDEGVLGEKRIDKTLESIKTIDIALLIITNNKFGSFEKELIAEFKKYQVPFFIIHNKSDIVELNQELKNNFKDNNIDCIEFSTIDGRDIGAILEKIKKTIPSKSWEINTIIGDLLHPNDIVMLITPMDSETPAGRLILPQVQMIRDVLDNNCICITLKETEVEHFFATTTIKPKLVITDSQIFKLADQLVPKDIPLTSFSLVLARHKGDFENYKIGTPKVDELKDGDRVLILESCSHHVSCEDIGRYKLPNWIKAYTQKQLEFDVVAGLSKIERPISDYHLIVQCGGCMITKKQVFNRLKDAVVNDIPVTNYGMLIAYMHGIYHRATKVFE